MNLRLLSTSVKRSLRSLAPPTTTTAGIHTAFPASFAYPTHTASNSGSHSTASPAFQSHTSDVYSKDVDTSPPENTKLHSIDPEAEVENPTASFPSAPSGDGNRAEVSTNEHQRVNTFSHPYVVPGESQNHDNMNQGS
ncbi:hypothetical protein M378DRAFT_15218 [Amanita muscaria Koide BX008]|uniref:Uncharacterized protein n=1 Tax=Amanita muscaria (strain Koide BX008) TaxID=946122 RepID=A0A0C2WRG3_AMAMK|nr:hypothetical protein M378DRAFT_15218 [Amanita muscaria Koide BX008]